MTMAVVVRVTSGRATAALVGLLIAAHAAGDLLRGWWVASYSELVWEALLPVVFVFGATVIVGLHLRGIDTAAARATEAAVAAAQQRERVDLARELHDVVAHHVGGIVVQAQAARVVAGTAASPEARVLPVIERAGTDALSAMRRMVTVLRGGRPGGDVPIRTTDLVADLRTVTATAPGGTPVRLSVDLPGPVPAEVATTVLRLVQESVTNARRHAVGAREIAVTVRIENGTVHILVGDDGLPRDSRRPGGGFGLIGMRERVQLLGGHFSAGRGPGGGWQIAAGVPLEEAGPAI